MGWAPGALGALLALMRARGRIHAAAAAPATAAAAAAASLDELDMDAEFARDGPVGMLGGGGGGAASMVGPLYASSVVLEVCAYARLCCGKVCAYASVLWQSACVWQSVCACVFIYGHGRMCDCLCLLCAC